MIKTRKLTGVKISSLALHELELNLKAGNILIEGKTPTHYDLAGFFSHLNELLSMYKIDVIPLTCDQISNAANLRSMHNLSFYDSHHAASAILYDSEIISTDKTYDHVSRLNRIDPYTGK
jgi:predicted nucleic acid-binding protein